MNDYKELIEMLRSMSRAIIREDAKLVDIPEENIWDADANAINDAADAIGQLVKERDAAVTDLKDFADCDNCKYKTDEYLENGFCRDCSVVHRTKYKWEWRGLEDNDGKID